jgi:hypothetical protein
MPVSSDRQPSPAIKSWGAEACHSHPTYSDVEVLFLVSLMHLHDVVQAQGHIYLDHTAWFLASELGCNYKYPFDICSGGVIPVCAQVGDCVMSICTVFRVLLKLPQNCLSIEYY